MEVRGALVEPVRLDEPVREVDAGRRVLRREIDGVSEERERLVLAAVLEQERAQIARRAGMRSIASSALRNAASAARRSLARQQRMPSSFHCAAGTDRRPLNSRFNIALLQQATAAARPARSAG